MNITFDRSEFSLAIRASDGEITGFGALWELHIAIRKGFDAKISHHDTSIEINKD